MRTNKVIDNSTALFFGIQKIAKEFKISDEEMAIQLLVIMPLTLMDGSKVGGDLLYSGNLPEFVAGCVKKFEEDYEKHFL